MRTALQWRPNRTSFTLIELLVVISVIGVLASIVILAINPNEQITAAKNATARQHLKTILNGLDQFSLDYERVPVQLDIPAINDNYRQICRGSVAVLDCTVSNHAFLIGLIPTYLADIPEDSEFTTELGTGYWVRVDEDGRYHVSSPDREIEIP